MYYPYFRGKQYELITIRENADLLVRAGFVPIIEPVKESLSGLIKALDVVNDAGGEAIVIINPACGNYSDDSEVLGTLISTELIKHQRISVGINLSDGISVNQAISLCDEHMQRPVTLFHAGFTEARALAEGLGEKYKSIRHVFMDECCGKLYRKHFKGAQRILLKDGFQRRANREHPPVEFFSDLHATYEEEGMDGFGDFLIVGDEFLESGGPAYAVAIHLTFIDPDKDDEMFIYHFVSDRQDTPTDPAGKFSEALRKLVAEVGRKNTNISRTQAVEEFLDLYKRGHFPGLGYVKKLSMKHHIEIMAEYFIK